MERRSPSSNSEYIKHSVDIAYEYISTCGVFMAACLMSYPVSDPCLVAINHHAMAKRVDVGQLVLKQQYGVCIYFI